MYNIESSLLLVGCSFSGNTAIYGGGIFSEDVSLIMRNCAFRGNSSRWRGGAIFNILGTDMVVTNCRFSGNSSSLGGAIDSSESTKLTLMNCTFAGNENVLSSTDFLTLEPPSMSSRVWVTNCIFWDGGNEILNLNGGPITVRYSDIQGGRKSVSDPYGGVIWGIGNIDADPCFAEPGYWDSNEVWVDGDYHLKSQAGRWEPSENPKSEIRNQKLAEGKWVIDEVTSLCIDAGNPGSPLGDEPITIPADPNNQWGENLRINMGAYGGTAEASMPPYNWTLFADLTNDGIVDFVDLMHWIEYWLSADNELPADLDRNKVSDLADFEVFADNWLKQTSWHN